MGDRGRRWVVFFLIQVFHDDMILGVNNACVVKNDAKIIPRTDTRSQSGGKSAEKVKIGR